MEAFFQGIDENNNREISWREFCQFYQGPILQARQRAALKPPPAPMLLVIMEPSNGVPEAPYAMHIVQNRPGTAQYNENRVVENFRGHSVIACTCPGKKKLKDEY